MKEDMLMDKPLVLGVEVLVAIIYHDQYQILRHSHYQIMLFLLLGEIIDRTGTAYATRYSLYTRVL
jgi:hypothetical protein